MSLDHRDSSHAEIPDHLDVLKTFPIWELLIQRVRRGVLASYLGVWKGQLCIRS